MIAFIGTRREFEIYCHEEFKTSARNAEVSRKAIFAYDGENLRGIQKHLTVVDTGTRSDANVGLVYREINIINCLYSGNNN